MTGPNANGTILKRAVTQNHALSRDGVSERLFAWLFKGLVYPQIWEDPEVDMAALAIQPGHRIVTIASGGCNALSYLTADPASVEAVDLNSAHVAFNRLKLGALKHLPDYASFYRFYGKADDKANLAAYQRFIRPHLDSESRAYWEKRKWSGRQRISIFSRDLYRHGLLGVFIGMGHRVARLYGIDPRDILKARTMEEQRSFFDTALAPCLKNAWCAGQQPANRRCLASAFRLSNMTHWRQPEMATWHLSCAPGSKSSPAPSPDRELFRVAGLWPWL